MSRLPISTFYRIVPGLALAALLLSSCGQPAQVIQPTNTAAFPPAPTTPAATAAPTQDANALPAVSMDTAGVAENATTQVVEAVPPGDTTAWTEVMPAHAQITLEGYPVSGHLLQPQIFAYRVDELGVNETAAKQAQDLQALLQNPAPGDQLPYLPLMFSARQALHPQFKTLAFQNGTGVRYLTEWHNGMGAVNNQALLYTFQGLTNDGKYYVSAVLPVNLAGLPATSQDTSGLPATFQEDYTQYMADIISQLDQAPDDAFTPDLSKLDALVQSLEVQ
jgi:hypothetical protein